MMVSYEAMATMSATGITQTSALGGNVYPCRFLEPIV